VTGFLQSTERSNLAESLREFHTETGRSLLDLVDESPVSSVITLKPAIRYQFKTGQRDWPKT
jgi:hypothetical protein